MWQCEPAPAGVAPRVIPRVAQEVAPPPRPRAEHAPRRVVITQAMLEEHGLSLIHISEPTRLALI
eukprot:9453819-Alexandrium_andersonii.AAC.1